MRQRQDRVHDEKHLAFIRSLPCLVSGNTISTEAAHIRYTDAAAGKFNPGVGAKPDDKWTVPLSSEEHRRQHSMGEKKYWELVGIDPIVIAKQLYKVSGDHEAGLEIVKNAVVGQMLANLSAG